jgi:hypothetical protein
MPQLVNRVCAICRECITSILDGEFCHACGNAVHGWCKRADAAVGAANRCHACGGDTSDGLARRARIDELTGASAERARQDQLRSQGVTGASKIALQIFGALVFLVGVALLIGNLSGAMPTFPFAGYIVTGIGSAMIFAGRIRS